MNKILILALGIFTMQSCMKDTFDKPATIQDPNLTANTTIQAIKDKYTSSGQTVMSYTSDDIISAVVIADDKSNNFYKEIVVQDGTAAIGIKIDRSNLYNDYPIGRRVFIKLKGMAMGNYNNLIQLGGYVDTVTAAGVRALGSVTTASLPLQIIKGSLGNEVKTLEVTSINALTNNDQYKLVKLKGMEFDCADISFTYADAVNQADASRNLSDGKTNTTNKAVVRTSGYSSFAGIKLAQGNGEFVGIYTVYRTTKQLLIRDTSDLKMTGTRVTACNGSGGGGGGGGTTGTPKTIKEIRDMFTGTGKALDGYIIEGIVISDKANGNVNSKTMIIQEQGGAGIAVYLNATNTFSLGDKVKINIIKDSLTQFKGLLQLSEVFNSDVTLVSSGNAITPAVKTISEINANIATLESTLVTVNSATLSGGTTFAVTSPASIKATDASGNIVLYTGSTASFATNSIPSGAKNITAIVSLFYTTKQLQMRNSSDIQ